jgi:hypothetical protein
MNSAERRSTRYKTLAAQGVTCGELRQTRSPNDSWTLQCRKIDAIENEMAKQLVTEFLREEWEAYRISFFRRVGTPTQIFFASFKSDAL